MWRWQAQAAARQHVMFALGCRQTAFQAAPATGSPTLTVFFSSPPCLYTGLSDFNARARASNFEPAELPAVMQYLHDRGAKGYVVLNVLGGWLRPGVGVVEANG